MIKITNKRIADYLRQKDVLVNEGRAISKELVDIEHKIATLDRKERKITEKVQPQELLEQGEKLKGEINTMVEELQKIGKAIEDAKIAAIPEDMVKNHYALRDLKEKKERERNKIALKIQKIKDKVSPIIRKEVKPLLKEEYDDIESADVDGDEIVIKTFNHLEEWKAFWRKKNKK